VGFVFAAVRDHLAGDAFKGQDAEQDDPENIAFEGDLDRQSFAQGEQGLFKSLNNDKQSDEDLNKSKKGFFEVRKRFLDHRYLKKGDDQNNGQNVQEGLGKFGK